MTIENEPNVTETYIQDTPDTPDTQVTDTQEADNLFSNEPDTDTETKTTDLIFGKFKDMESAEKSYMNMWKKLEEKSPQPPEPSDEFEYGYDFKTAFEEAGMQAMDLTDDQGNEIPEVRELYDNLANDIREAGFTQSQLSTMTRIGNQWLKTQMESFASEFGPSVDVKAEQAKLPEIFGDDYEQTVSSVSKWAQSNLPSEVFTKPLYQTAEGMKLLNKLRTQGNEPLNTNVDSQKPVRDIQEIDTELDALMRSKEYKQTYHPDHKGVSKKVSKLIDELERAKKSK